MSFFDDIFEDIREYLLEKKPLLTQWPNPPRHFWPEEKNRNLVLGPDTAVELGHPRDVSTAFLIWVNGREKLHNGCVSLVGPDVPELVGRQSPFGRVVMVAGEDFDAENAHGRWREMEMARYDVGLKGYMMRGVSQEGREWSRISREAAAGGFSFRVLGRALLDRLLGLDYVKAAEIVFITASSKDVARMKAIGDRAIQRLSAMNKMAGEMGQDCASCDYKAVCGEVAGLRAMRAALQKKKAAAYA